MMRGKEKERGKRSRSRGMGEWWKNGKRK